MTIKLFIDLETLPDLRPGAKDRARESLKVPGNYSKPETIEKWKDENAEDAWRKTSFDGGYGSICVIGYAFDDLPVKTIIADDEQAALSAFLLELECYQAAENMASLEWIGHNVLNFDLPFLWKRSVIHNLPRNIPKDARHGAGKVFDTMTAWAGFKDRISLSNLADILQLPNHKEGFDGSMVYDAWAAGGRDKVAAYCADDVELTRQIYRRIV